MNQLRIGAGQFDQLRKHLLRGDGDEHGALLLAGHYPSNTGHLLTVKEVIPLAEHEFPPGQHGYKQFAASALARIGNRAAAEKLSLVSIHSHPGSLDRNSLSGDDLRSHERVFPHMLDITQSDVVSGIALGERSVAGELWTRDGERSTLDCLKVIGPRIQTLYPQPLKTDLSTARDPRFDRQVRLFGETGQSILGALRVVVVGAGGGGSILIEQLAHLGVGHITAIDYDVVKRHNLSRIMGASIADVDQKTKKIAVAERLVNSIDPTIHFDGIDGDIAELEFARKLIEADWVFLATDTATARLVANAVAQMFLVPTVQIGAKVDVHSSGRIEQIYTAVRPIMPDSGCLSCAGLIDAIALQREAASPEERANQNYLGEVEIVDPSVTTLNLAAAAAGLNVMLLSAIGLANDGLIAHRVTLTRDGSVLSLQPDRDPACRWCGNATGSRFARADISLLPARRAIQSVPSPEWTRSNRRFSGLEWVQRLVRSRQTR